MSLVFDYSSKFKRFFRTPLLEDHDFIDEYAGDLYFLDGLPKLHVELQLMQQPNQDGLRVKRISIVNCEYDAVGEAVPVDTIKPYRLFTHHYDPYNLRSPSRLLKNVLGSRFSQYSQSSQAYVVVSGQG